MRLTERGREGMAARVSLPRSSQAPSYTKITGQPRGTFAVGEHRQRCGEHPGCGHDEGDLPAGHAARDDGVD